MPDQEPNPTYQLLGKRLGTYRGVRPARWLRAFVGSTFLGVWCGLSVGLLSGLGLWTALVVGVTAVLWTNFRVTWPRLLELHQNGLEYFSWVRRRRVYWHQVCEVYRYPLHPLLFATLASPSPWAYRLVCRDGSQLLLHHFEGLTDLGERIEDQLARRQLPMAMSAYSTGYTLRFGRHLALNTEGIHVRRRFIAWHEIAEISLGLDDEFLVSFRQKSERPLRIPCRRIANLKVLDGILQSIRTGEAEDLRETDIAHRRSDFAESQAARGPLQDDGDPQGEEAIEFLPPDGELDEIEAWENGHISLEELREIGRRQRRPRHPR